MNSKKQWNKKFTQSIVLMISALALVCGAVFAEAPAAEAPAAMTVAGSHGKAGIVASLEETENRMLDAAQLDDVTVEQTQTQVVTVASKSDAADKAAEKEAEKDTEKELSKTEQEWQDKVMADVDDFLCIREKGDSDAKILGKLYKTSVAKVIKKGKSWTKIKSGDVKGYVKNSYLLFGSDAYENAKKVCKKYAYVQTDGLRIRKEADEEATVLGVADKGDKLLYDKNAKKTDGWVAVSVSAGDGYVADEYVTVKLGTTEAVSIEEELAAQKAKAQKAKAQQAASTQHASTNASVDDTLLLAAIIQCEAGSECYEGKVAVGAVVLNRVRSSRYPNSISGVIYQRGQFGPASNGSLARALSGGNISNSCKQAAAEALAGADPTGGKLSFHRANGRAGLVIGNHVFF